MEFKFKRKYTKFAILTILLHTLVLIFWLFAPSYPFNGAQEKNTIALLSLINIELILVFYLGLYRRKYFAYYNQLKIKRSFFKTLTISYSSITTIKENDSDSILFGFGIRPSFIIYYKNSNGKRN